VKETPLHVLPTDRCIALAVQTHCCTDDDNSDDAEDNFFFDMDDSSVETIADADNSPDAHGCETVDDDDVIEASPHEIFASQVVVESLIANNVVTGQTNTTNLPEYAFEDLPNFMYMHEGGDDTNSNNLGDTPIVLVGDNSSVCLPCRTEDVQDVQSGTAATGRHGRPSNSNGIGTEICEEEMQKIHEDEKEKN